MEVHGGVRGFILLLRVNKYDVGVTSPQLTSEPGSSTGFYKFLTCLFNYAFGIFIENSEPMKVVYTSRKQNIRNGRLDLIKGELPSYRWN